MHINNIIENTLITLSESLTNISKLIDKGSYYIITEIKNLTKEMLINKCNSFDMCAIEGGYQALYFKEYDADISILTGSEIGYSAHDNRDTIYKITLKDNSVEDFSSMSADEALYKALKILKSSKYFDLVIKWISRPNSYVRKEYIEQFNNIVDNLDENKNGLYEKINNIYSILDNAFHYLLSSIAENTNKTIIKIRYEFNEKGIVKNFINLNNIVDITKVHSKSEFLSEPDPKEGSEFNTDSDAFIALRKFMSTSGKTISSQFFDVYKKLGYVGEKPVKVYRGMSWDPMNLFKLKDLTYPFKLNQTLSIKNKRSTSWTTDLSVAEGFVENSLFIILEMTIEPNDIIVDTRLIPKEIRSELYRAFQREVILKPGKYIAKIIEIGNGSDEDVTVGFEGYDINQYIEIYNTLKSVYDKLESDKSFHLDLSFEDKNKVIFSDYAVESPLIKIGKNNDKWRKYGVVGPRDNKTYTDKKESGFSMIFLNWGYKRSDEKKQYNTYEELITYMKSDQFYNDIIQFFSNA